MNKVIGWLLYLLFLAAVIFLGWDQPLKVHFLSKEAAAASMAASAQGGSSGAWMYDKSRYDALARPTPTPKPFLKSPYD